MENKKTVKFIGNAIVALVVTFPAVEATAAVIDGAFIPTVAETKEGETVAVYHVSTPWAKANVAVPTNFDSDMTFIPKFNAVESKKAFTNLVLTKRVFLVEALEAAKKAEIAEAAAIEEDKKKAAEAAAAKAKAAKEEAEAYAKHEAQAKALREKIKAEGQAAKKFLDELLLTVEVGNIIYKSDKKSAGKVTKIDKNLYGYYAKDKGKEEIFVPMHEAVKEENMVEATFNGTEPEKVISRNLFNKKMSAIKAAGLDYKAVEAANYKPEFRFVQDNLNGANKDENGEFVHFATREIKK